MKYGLPERQKDRESNEPRIVGRFSQSHTNHHIGEYFQSPGGRLCYLTEFGPDIKAFLAFPIVRERASDLNQEPFDVLLVDIPEAVLKLKTPRELRQMVPEHKRKMAKAIEFAYFTGGKAEISLYEARS